MSANGINNLAPYSCCNALSTHGKVCVARVEGEYEHGNAFFTTRFVDPVREAIGGGEAWTTGKRGGAGTTIETQAQKDALYVRSHYDTFTVSLAEARAPDEIVVLFALTTRGRLHARLGGLNASDVKKYDGLR